MSSKQLVATIILLTVLIAPVSMLKCYSGFKYVRGQKITETEECSSSFDFCYRFTATAAVLAKVKLAGCSTFRCQLARNTCRNTTLGGVPMTLCCCSEDLCNGNTD